MFVVVLTGASGQVFTAPRAVGPFDNWDAAQDLQKALVAQWEAEGADEIPTATVVRIEEPMPGVVVGEI
ncbi:MAG: hypothetical protein JWM76_3408 [Pseudonocardiales bacterium]|nr:hypothetical protein [Pseudonocardiales bacterium]